jgi:hypothetical protein
MDWSLFVIRRRTSILILDIWDIIASFTEKEASFASSFIVLGKNGGFSAEVTYFLPKST